MLNFPENKQMNNFLHFFEHPLWLKEMGKFIFYFFLFQGLGCGGYGKIMQLAFLNT